MKYLVLEEIKSKYRIRKSFDNLTEAMSFALREKLVGTGLVVKVMENWKVIEK